MCCCHNVCVPKGTDESFRDALRSLGGESAASLWRVSSQSQPRCVWVKQGFMQKVHEVDPMSLVNSRLENEDLLVNKALKIACHKNASAAASNDTSFLALENVKKPQNSLHPSLFFIFHKY